MFTNKIKKYFSPSAYASFYRFGLNLWPCIRGGGGKVTYISDDFKRLTVQLKLRLRTRNVVGTIYGGSMYASTDPMFMLMLLEILGPDYVVWDKGCTIRFKKPATRVIEAKFIITDEMLEEILKNVHAAGEHSFTWKADYRDSDNQVYCEFDKLMYVAKKDFYKEKLKKRESQKQ
jgi:hypothetical protein